MLKCDHSSKRLRKFGALENKNTKQKRKDICMFETSRLRKRTRSAVIGLAASGMVIGSVASATVLSTSPQTFGDSGSSKSSANYVFDVTDFDSATLTQ